MQNAVPVRVVVTTAIAFVFFVAIAVATIVVAIARRMPVRMFMRMSVRKSRKIGRSTFRMTAYFVAVNRIDFYRSEIVDIQAFSAVIANFKRVEVAKFALAAAYALAVV